jgi:hypothetical protein
MAVAVLQFPMKKLLCVLGATILLAACATSPAESKADAEAHAACRDVDPPIGSHLVKRKDCGAASQAKQDPDQARREADLLRQSQTLRNSGGRLTN